MNIANTRRPAGFSLVEIMVALAISLVTVLVIGQVMQVASQRQRNVSSGADANINGTLALYTIERDGKNAGFGMTTITDSIGCPIKGEYDGETRNFDLVPAVVVDGQGGAPDMVRFMASNKNGVTLPTRIAVDHPRTAANFFVDSDLGMQIGDMVIAVPAVMSTANPPTTWCSLFQVTGTGGGNGNGGNGGSGNANGGGQGQNQVLHNSGLSPWNQPGGSSIFPPAGYAAGDVLVNLGNFIDHTYSIADGRILRQTAYDMKNHSTGVFDLYPNIVQLQAVYGKDTSPIPDRIVDVWEVTAPASQQEWKQVVALRVAIVARGDAPENEVVTLDGADAASACDSPTPHPAAVCWHPDPAANGVKIDVSSVPNWQRYRYRVFDTTIPLRNAIWQQ